MLRRSHLFLGTTSTFAEVLDVDTPVLLSEGFSNLPECKTLKKISFMLPTSKMEFDHGIDTRKH